MKQLSMLSGGLKASLAHCSEAPGNLTACFLEPCCMTVTHAYLLTVWADTSWSPLTMNNKLWMGSNNWAQELTHSQCQEKDVIGMIANLESGRVEVRTWGKQFFLLLVQISQNDVLPCLLSPSLPQLCFLKKNK